MLCVAGSSLCKHLCVCVYWCILPRIVNQWKSLSFFALILVEITFLIHRVELLKKMVQKISVFYAIISCLTTLSKALDFQCLA